MRYESMVSSTSLVHCLGLGKSPDEIASDSRDEQMVHISLPFKKYPCEGTCARTLEFHEPPDIHEPI